MAPRSSKMRWLPVALIAAALVVWLILPSRAEVKRYVPNAEDAPTMSTRDVSTLISDSGYTRYHLTTPLWEMYENAEEPYWAFPAGIELEQYDLRMNPESTVVCDSAVYFSRKRLWRLDGNVVMVSTAADSFLTQQLFWDQNNRKIYSDSFIHIVRSDRTIEGYGFESDQSMLYYTVKHPTAILPADRRPGRRNGDSTATDTATPPITPMQRSSTAKPASPAAPGLRATDDAGSSATTVHGKTKTPVEPLRTLKPDKTPLKNTNRQ